RASTTCYSLLLRPAPPSPLFPYTTLFRSLRQRLLRRRDDRGGNLRLGGNNGEGKRFGSSGHRFGRRGFRLHRRVGYRDSAFRREDRKSTRLNSSHVKISYAVFCLKKKRKP